MKILLLILLVVTTAQAAEPKPQFKYDPTSPDALAAKAKYEEYRLSNASL
jgi:hypothetical protein